ncbi:MULTISPECIES: hypothetical protein [Pseudomonadaceae]|uniref:hypothetical protein n=1 Tax=Pseudomonadaceae TaxID=135621 RepID=UPI000ABA863E|nr:MULTISPECIES: hypothetical protein [Pseudomonadaceae]MDS9414903.1 hypothetical protein [Pseudomonas aeruginosa]MDS9433117.1 hypothetical protein [Pseudomonas aeruginosa]MDS9497128.1 hypothetical protein [Pseudomonas aeruginosa]MDS9562096.1 hypothetical protein [Pseudomonas aeruginosa]MDS9575226.1 hypothetical protein [Pseudomonas aeruginosa]|tara:strand:+ start:1857 stop:2291 length:435 start_codon:yes stop_codon:yes gene_type:complete
MRQNRTKKTSLVWTPAEHEKILKAKEAAGERSIADLVLRLIDDSQTIVIKEIKSYDDVYSKAGNLANQIAKALHLIKADPRKYSALIAYLEKDNSRVLNALADFSDKLDEAVDAYFQYEENIEIVAQQQIAKAKKEKNKKSGAL